MGDLRGVAQLWVDPSYFEASFSDPRSLLKQLEVRGILKREGKGKDSRLSIYKAVRENSKKDRVHVFAIPDFEDWLEENGYPRPKRRRR